MQYTLFSLLGDLGVHTYPSVDPEGLDALLILQPDLLQRLLPAPLESVDADDAGLDGGLPGPAWPVLGMQQRDPIGPEVAVHAGGEEGRRSGGRDRRRRRRGRLVPLGHLHLVESGRGGRLRLQLGRGGIGVAARRRQGRPGGLVDVGRRDRVRRLAVVRSATEAEMSKCAT